jgi:hypothetical protein
MEPTKIDVSFVTALGLLMPTIVRNVSNSKKTGMAVPKLLTWAPSGKTSFTKEKSTDSPKRHEIPGLVELIPTI